MRLEQNINDKYGLSEYKQKSIKNSNYKTFFIL